MTQILHGVSSTHSFMAAIPYWQWYRDNTFYKYKNHVIFYDVMNALNIHIVMSLLQHS